jgi:PAS domain S-box-containing protein
MNERWYEFTGQRADEPHGFGWINAVHPDDIEPILHHWQRCRETGKPFEGEARYRRKDGVYRWHTFRAVPSRNEAGAIEKWFGCSVDVHDMKLAEDALRMSEKLASVGRLASSIAHEINNPLEAVTNLLYLADTSAVSPDTKKYIQMAQRELSRVAQIATQTLRFYRQSHLPVQVRMPDMIDSVLALYQGRLANSNITVERRFDDVSVRCYEGEMRQVLNNLVANAIDAMRDIGGGRLIVGTHAATDLLTGQQGVRVTVADTGSGMSPETQKRLFEPFYSTKGINGTGLGLWVSSGILEKHQGTINVRSSQHPNHRGTVFSIFVPDMG